MTSEYLHILQPSPYFSGFSLILHEQGLLEAKYGVTVSSAVMPKGRGCVHSACTSIIIAMLIC
jgi:hypothetical protein